MHTAKKSNTPAPARTREEVVRRSNVQMRKVFGAVPKDKSLGVSFRLNALPPTSQGVRNLDVLAPAKARNGNRFRKPKHFEAICPHPEEAMSEDLLEEQMEGRDEFGEEYTYVLRFRTCSDCGAEVSA